MPNDQSAGLVKLVNNLTFKGPVGGTSLSFTASFVTIDLAGFSITGPGDSSNPSGQVSRAIQAGDDTTGIAVRNGSISGFPASVGLPGSNNTNNMAP